MGADQVVVRMYNVGFGDCFLVSVPTAAGRKHILIDCGTHPASTGPRRARTDAMPRLFEDLSTETGRLAVEVVVATHRHMDHISAFAAPDWAKLDVGEVWMPWTENPDDPVATSLRERMGLHLAALAAMRSGLASQAKPTAALAASLSIVSSLIDNNRELLSDESADALGLAIRNESSMATLWSGFAGSPRRRYLSAGIKPLTTPVLPGVVVHILGPGTGEKVIRDLEPPPSETFAHVEPRGVALDAIPRPFDDGWTKSWKDFQGNPAFADLRVSSQIVGTIRQLAAEELLAAAASLESSVNGTSLMFVLEVGGVLLFFPGDAQWGTWEMVLADKRARSLIQRSRFYKIGHHGSHNASPRTFVEQVMAADSWAAVPVSPVKVWPQIPQADLIAGIKARNIKVVQSDVPPIDGSVPNVTVRDDTSIDFTFDIPEPPGRGQGGSTPAAAADSSSTAPVREHGLRRRH